MSALPSLHASIPQSLKKTLVCLMVLAILVFSLFCIAFYPGTLSPDSYWQYWQAKTLYFSASHPPIMALLWHFLDKLIPGAGGFFIFHIGCAVAAAFVLSLIAFSKGKTFYFLPLIALFLPNVCNILFVIWKDVSLAVSLCLGFSLWYYWREKQALNKKKFLIIFLLIFYAACVRFNGVTAVFPLIVFFLADRFSFRKAAILGVVISAAFYFANDIFTFRILKVKRTIAPFQEIMAHDLMGIYAITGKNYFPPEYLSQSRLNNIMKSFDHQFADATTFISDYYLSQDPVLVAKLQKQWKTGILQNPFAYLEHRALLYGSFLTLHRNWLYHLQAVSSPSPEGTAYLHLQSLTTERTAGHFITHFINWVFQHFVFVFEGFTYFLAAFIILIFFAIPKRSIPLLALTTSSLCYILPYFFIAPEVSYRYIYWSVIAVLLSCFVLWMERTSKKRDSHETTNVNAYVPDAQNAFPKIQKKQRNDQILALISIILFISLSNIVWIYLDKRPQPFIDAYPRQTLEFYDAIRTEPLRNFITLLFEMSVKPRPPLYQLLSVPFIYCFGRSLQSMLLINVVFLMILMIAIYFAGMMLRNWKVGVVGALLVATYPPIVDLSRIFRPHSALPACVSLTLSLLICVIKYRTIRSIWLCGASLGFGFLIHPNSFYLLLPITLLVVLYVIFIQEDPSRPSSFQQSLRWFFRKIANPLVYKAILPAGIFAFAIAAMWYVPVLKESLQLSRDAAAAWTNVTYGFPYKASFWWAARTMPGAISLVFAGLLAAALLFNVLRPRHSSSALVAAFLLMYCSLSLRTGAYAWMNFAAFLPVVALISAIFLFDFSHFCASLIRYSTKEKEKLIEYARRAFILFFIAIAILNFSIVSWGIPAFSKTLRRRIGIPTGSTCEWRMNVAFCPNPPKPESWPMKEILLPIAQDEACRARLCTVAVVTENLDNFHYSALMYFAHQEFPEFHLRIVPIRDYPKYNLNWLSADYEVYIPQLKNNPYSTAVVSLLETTPDILQQVFLQTAIFPLPENQTAKLIKRTRVVTKEDTINIIRMLQVRPEIKNQLLETLRPSRTDALSQIEASLNFARQTYLLEDN